MITFIYAKIVSMNGLKVMVNNICEVNHISYIEIGE
jgi:hypothetical protein